MAVVALTCVRKRHYLRYAVAAPDVGAPGDWRDLGAVPRARERDPPQGMTLAGDQIVHSNHWKDVQSRLYLLAPRTMTVLAVSAMPAEAGHTSGLAWDGRWLWAIDYLSRKIYQLDLERTFRQPTAEIVGSWRTGLGGPSAIAVVHIHDGTWLAVSDFLNTARTYLLPMTALAKLESKTVPVLATISYSNGGFSQGLAWDGRYLYEAVNNAGVDRIEVLDIAEALRSADAGRVRRLGSFSGPGSMIEDLTTDGTRMWTCDEESFRFSVLWDYRKLVARLRDDEHSWKHDW